MARKEKILKEMANNNLDRREIGYYSTPSFICEYISSRLIQINSTGKKILDPCCGKEELIASLLNKGFEIDTIDIIKYKEEYFSNFTQKDFIEDYCLRKKSYINSECKMELGYDYYIANPPYNCHEVNFIKNNKDRLKECFSDVGLHNMYSMFISAIIDSAKEGAVIGLITHDSFLTSKHHKNLRKKIIQNCVINEITMCSTDLFLSQGADVRTSIIILTKKYGGEKHSDDKKIIVNNRPINSKLLKEKLLHNISAKVIECYSLNELLLCGERDNLEFVIECPVEIKGLFNSRRLGDVFKCVTGISTGNDKLFLSTEKDEKFNVPFYKNPGKDKFYTEKYVYLHKDFLSYDKEIKNFIVRNKSLLYQGGITCSSMGVEFTASILPTNCTYGVNANIILNDKEKWWLLAYLNSTLVAYFVRGVLTRSNMITSGYVSRIPLIDIEEVDKNKLSYLGKEGYNKAFNNECVQGILLEIDKIVNKSARLSKKSEKLICEFKNSIIKST